MAPDLRVALQDVARVMAPFPRHWWIIGSAALALHGIRAGTVQDIDLLVDESLVAAVLARMGIAPLKPAPDPLFRSAVFARWIAPPVPVEVMAGFQVRVGDQWRTVALRSRERIEIEGGASFVPDRSDLLSLFGLFGRAKDGPRIAALERAGAPPPPAAPTR
ncbi:hypothetical protein RN629_00145 [Sphingomonadaceae bacterium jetA1]|jgi:hypothetical protein|uniref:hypothetical protein n=1 Tax=Facivitalis istanbulensis TaxID=3075838 RepID=UPI003495874B